MCVGDDTCLVSDLLARSFGSRDNADRERIVSTGRPTPELPNFVQQTKSCVRRFNKSLYTENVWLTACAKENKLYCWFCLLFAPRATGGPFLSYGVSDLNNFNNKKKAHLANRDHLLAATALLNFGRDLDINQQVSVQEQLNIAAHNSRVFENRKLLRIFLDVIIFLGKQELPFRGHDESPGSLNRGNFMECLKLISNYSGRLKAHFVSVQEAASSGRRIFSGFSPDIQNDLVLAIQNVMLREIKTEVANAPFVSLMLDESTDNYNLSQMSTVLRYIGPEGKVVERFISFTDVSADRTAGALSKLVVSLVEKWQFGDKFVSQGYDGAAVMAGNIRGLKTRVREKFPYAVYIHCNCHILNLVLKDVFNKISECRIFFTTLDSFASFFSNASARTHALDTIVKKRFPALLHVRWCFSSRLVNTVFEFRGPLTELFEDMSDGVEWDGTTRTMARGFLGYIQDFNFMFQLIIHKNIFQHTDIVFKMFQQRGVSVSEIKQRVDCTVEEMERQKSNFEQIYEECVHLVGEPRPTRKRLEPKAACKLLYSQIYDMVIEQMQVRFAGLEELKFVDLLNKRFYQNYRENFPSVLLNKLISTYGKFFDKFQLKNELAVIYCGADFSELDIHQLYTYLRPLSDSFCQSFKLCSLILTLASTTVSVETSFSTMDRIKNYRRVTMTNPRLSGLSLMAIEKKLLVDLESRPDFEDRVINAFCSKTRIIDLQFK